MKKIAILQSNYIPWKGYFDLIASVDEFIIYDEMQFTKNDWRNRNLIKTAQGVQWLTVPVGQKIHRRICDVVLADSGWQKKHWKTLCQNYRKACYFNDIAVWLEPLYFEKSYTTLTEMNTCFIAAICAYLNIATAIKNSWEYSLEGDRSERLVNICKQAGGDIYVSGLAAKSYLDEGAFDASRISVQWFTYENYKEYPQLYGEFVHQVTILDALFHCGPNTPGHMKYCIQP